MLFTWISPPQLNYPHLETLSQDFSTKRNKRPAIYAPDA